MRRLPYHQKNTSYMNRSQRGSKQQQQIDQLKFRLQLNKFVSSSDQPYLSSRTAKYPFTQKQVHQHLIAKRPYTTQRSNSLNEIKKQDHDNNYKKNYSTNKNNAIINKSHNDFLLVSSHTPKQKHYQSSLLNNYSLTGYNSKINNQSSINRGKIHRGISHNNKHQQKLSSGKDYSFDSKKIEHHIAQSNYQMINSMRQSVSRSQRNNYNNNYQSNNHTNLPNNYHNSHPIDLIGRNLRKSLASKSDSKDNFFQYVMRFSYKTKKGYTPSNPNKINQDAYITSPNINNKTWEHLFGICDGHGPLGHLVSDFVKQTLPDCISKLKNIEKNPIHSLMKAFDNAYDKLIRDSHVDMSFSGSTVIMCYFLQNRIYCCNVGDSRAIMGKHCKDNSWKSIALSTDHKPNLPLQAERIKKSKGRVEAYKDEFGQQIGPLRVWLKHDNVPGLAMTRSFGDLVGASVGVSHQPQIKQFVINEQDKIFVIASDGVFEFLSNEQIVQAMVPYYEKKQIQQGSDHLLNMAHRSWNKNSSIIDDITFILIFMNYNQ